MKLLFDQNLSFRLCGGLADVFPASSHIRLVGLDRADDAVVWRYAAEHGFALVTLDSDFADLAAVRGPPPKIVWLRLGNQPTPYVQEVLRRHRDVLIAFDNDPLLACVEVY